MPTAKRESSESIAFVSRFDSSDATAVAGGLRSKHRQEHSFALSIYATLIGRQTLPLNGRIHDIPEEMNEIAEPWNGRGGLNRRQPNA